MTVMNSKLPIRGTALKLILIPLTIIFSVKSGTTGEALAANSALGVTSNQSASNVSVGRVALDQFGEPVPTDDLQLNFPCNWPR